MPDTLPAPAPAATGTEAPPSPAPATAPAVASPAPAVPPRRPGRKRGRSPLLRRILVLNVAPLLLLVAGLLYADDYHDGLIDAESSALRVQAQIFAGAIAESATSIEDRERPVLVDEWARPLLRRLIEPTPNNLARLYGVDGQVIADSRVIVGPGGTIVTEPLPPTAPRGPLRTIVTDLYDAVLSLLPRHTEQRIPPDVVEWGADIREEVGLALEAEILPIVRRSTDGRLILSVGVPVQRLRKTVGALLLTHDASYVDDALFGVRLTILKLFGAMLLLTVLASIYLARTIAQPARRLAAAARALREGRAGQTAIPPDIVARRDEIGELAQALDQSTGALLGRLDAIERFAADVSHEIKNPLTSIRSAVETLQRLKDPVRQERLLQVIAEDVRRLDRLITDISDASRVDAELSRAQTERVDLGQMLNTLAEIHDSMREENAPRLVVHAPPQPLPVRAVEGRLVQVWRNLIANAISFSPPGGTITVTAAETGSLVEVAVEDEGPGIPEGKLDAIFDRFYSERPKGERFGAHSGLGLSISRQIVNAHRGTISAGNRRDAEGKVIGARFVVRLPKAA
ncbi:MAG: stimulus-sensing domain-containing protein [Alphaproteobacteria bacterium]|nr:stimulus-sensing domain-containing protein [Alphaproteobacteria bacterium]